MKGLKGKPEDKKNKKEHERPVAHTWGQPFKATSKDTRSGAAGASQHPRARVWQYSLSKGVQRCTCNVSIAPVSLPSFPAWQQEDAWCERERTTQRTCKVRWSRQDAWRRSVAEAKGACVCVCVCVRRSCQVGHVDAATKRSDTQPGKDVVAHAGGAL